MKELIYTEDKLLRLAKRINNTKRSYLLVNPLQGKHMPVSPDEALEMMHTLGQTVRANISGVPLVIGFSETATAIGAAVALEISRSCIYLQTTRERDETVRSWVYFSEEHSHATEQKLCGDDLDKRIACSDYVLLVDDEISTGKTILNVVAAIRRDCLSAKGKAFVVASIINRIDDNRLPYFENQGITFISLLKLNAGDYEERLRGLTVTEAVLPKTGDNKEADPAISILSSSIPPAHRGLVIEDYFKACQAAIKEILGKICISKDDDVLVLGTEEFMLPALLLAYRIQELLPARSVKMHATTRSPIGINPASTYPIKNGIRLHSLYSIDRVTYLYNLEHYDKVIVFSDAPKLVREAAIDIQRGLEEKHCSKVWFIYSCQYV